MYLSLLWFWETQPRSVVLSKEHLWLELQKAWDNVSVEVLRKCIDTMPESCAAVIAAKGGHDKY